MNVGTLTPPYVLEAISGTVRGVANTLRLHTVATDEGLANITPLTELLVARLVLADPTRYFTNVDASGGTDPLVITDMAITTAQTAVVNQLRTLATPVDVATVQPFITTPFAAVEGDSTDARIEAFQQALTASDTTLAALVTQLANPTNTGGSGSTCVGTFGSLNVALISVMFRGETPSAVVLCPAQPRIEALATDATRSVYNFATEAVQFTTPGGQKPTQSFTLTVNTSDGATVRSLSYRLAATSTTLSFTLDCTSQRTECSKITILPATGGTTGNHTISVNTVTLTQAPDVIGGSSGPGSVRLTGTLVTVP